jgi:choline dehydrogenase-like flavoprotein
MQQEPQQEPVNPVRYTSLTSCCVVGAGPAGMILALLLARQGVHVTLLESHVDFDRDFRGDTVHSSVLNILDAIDQADLVLQLPHTRLYKVAAQTASGMLTFSDYSWIWCKYPFEFLVAQSLFLNLLAGEAKRYPSFRLIMGAQANELITQDGVVRGVRYQGQDGHGAAHTLRRTPCGAHPARTTPQARPVTRRSNAHHGGRAAVRARRRSVSRSSSQTSLCWPVTWVRGCPTWSRAWGCFAICPEK